MEEQRDAITREEAEGQIAERRTMSFKHELIAQLHRGVPVSLSALLRRSLDVMSVAVIGHLGSSAMSRVGSAM